MFTPCQRFDNVTYAITRRVRASTCMRVYVFCGRVRGVPCTCARVRAFARGCKCLRLFVCVYMCVRAGTRGRCAYVCTSVCVCVGSWTRVCVFFLGCVTMPGYRRLGKNKITNNSLTNKDEVRHFSVNALHTHLLAPKPLLYLLWY